jgi:hypothetical protein
VPVSVREEINLEVAGRVEDTPIQAPLAPLVDAQNCRSVGIPSTGLDELNVATSPRAKADVRHMTDLAQARHFLTSRFWIVGSDALHGRGIGVDVLLASRQNEHPGVVQARI